MLGFFELLAKLSLGEFIIPLEGNMIDLHLVASVNTDKHAFFRTERIHRLGGNVYLGIEEALLAILIRDIGFGLGNEALVKFFLLP